MKIEICTNREWWQAFGGLDVGLEDGFGDERVDEYIGHVWGALEAARHDVEGAQGQRIFCHGWNGANTFARKSGGIGTFDDVTKAEWKAANEIVDMIPVPKAAGS